MTHELSPAQLAEIVRQNRDLQAENARLRNIATFVIAAVDRVVDASGAMPDGQQSSGMIDAVGSLAVVIEGFEHVVKEVAP